MGNDWFQVGESMTPTVSKRRIVLLTIAGGARQEKSIKA
jgi:hypothetical protein